jgi:hypothetical protein
MVCFLCLWCKSFSEDALEKGMLLAFEGDLSHQCMGRSAPQRLKRTLELASELQLNMFSLPVVQVFFMGQKFIEEMRGFSLMALEQKIKKIYSKMSI